MNTIKFFVPHTNSKEQAESVYANIKHFIIEQGNNPSEDRIYCIRYWHNEKLYTDTVGEKAGLEPNEDVIAILKITDNLYCICTPNRGVIKGSPILCNPVFTVPFAV